MSYDIRLYRRGIRSGNKVYYDYEENITYNVNQMLEEVFGKNHLKKWNNLPICTFYKKLLEGVTFMENNKNVLSQFDSPNGWGTVNTTLPRLQKLVQVINTYIDNDGCENVYLEFE